MICCEYCDLKEYRGELFSTSKYIDGGNQNFEICIFDSPEEESRVLEIDGIYTDVRINISYCPMCGRKL